MIKTMRFKLYQSILRKEVGWFDHKSNAPSALTASIAGDIQSLSGVSAESIAVTLEGILSLSAAVVIGFVFSWKITLVTLGMIPFIVFSFYIMQASN